MTDHLKMSRPAKALTDRANGAASFDEAEERLKSVRVAVILMPDQAKTAAGQAAALTALNASVKCFGSAVVVVDPQLPLVRALPLGDTLYTAATALGATTANSVPSDATHIIAIGSGTLAGMTVFVRCWWNGWTAGILPPWDDRAYGASGNPLAGVFSGALAVREVFATVLGYPRCGSRVSVASLWEPGLDPELVDPGPDTVYFPRRLWFVALGHLGQGFLWSLGFLPLNEFEAVLQDDQRAGIENEATGLLTRTGDRRRKARIAADWLDRLGWETRLIERRHFGDIPRLDDDPAIVITGLDRPDVRIKIAQAGTFDYLVDAGVGHGPVDFEALQIRILRKGVDAGAFWSSPESPKDIDSLMKQPAYRTHEAQSGRCGSYTLAEASVAVPFVGAAVGALTIAQAIRLASLQSSVQIMQMELGAPGMAAVGGMNAAPTQSQGSVEVQFMDASPSLAICAAARPAPAP